MSEKKIRFLMFIILLGFLIKASLSLYAFIIQTPLGPIAFGRAEAASMAAQNKKEDRSSEVMEKKKDDMNHQLLLELIKRKEKELLKKEEALRLEQERLQAMKRDIEDKLAQILQASEDLRALTIKKNKHVEENIIRLAKVFESTPPENAGPLLEKLDTEIAAQILLRMNGKKAGAVWGYVKPDKALKIIKHMSRYK